MFDWFWEFLYGIVKAALYCIDFIADIAEMLCGIEPVTVEGSGEVDITSYFLMHESVIDAFRAVVLIGFAMLVVFTIYSIIRAQGTLGEGKSPVRICLGSAKILIYFLLVPLIMYLASGCISYLMNIIYQATAAGGGTSIGSSMFSIFADEAYSSSSPKDQVMADFLNGTKDYYSTSEVSAYFDLEDFNYFLGFVGGIAVLVLLALSLLSFVERLLSLMILFIVAPLSMSTAALDDGARFKLWRDQTINKFLMAYGSLICINLYMMMVNIVNGISFFDPELTFFNGLARLAFIIGGAFACRKGGVLIGNLINTGAGTQDAMDQANINRGFGGLATLVAGKALAVAGFFAKPVAKASVAPARATKEHIKKNVSSSVHRSSNAKRSAKDEVERQKYISKLRAKEAGHAAKGAPGAGGSGITETLRGAAQSPSPTQSGSGARQTERPDGLNQTSSQITRQALASAAQKKEGGESDRKGE